MRVAVVGHVEWVDLVRVGRLPAAGEIVHAGAAWSGPAGGGAVAAVQLRRLAGAATLFTALGADELGWRARAELEALGVRVVAAVRPEPQRRALVHVSADGERTITVVGERMGPRVNDRLPWGELAACDAVYVTAGDAGAIRAARAATVLGATPRALAPRAGAGAELDALVGSGIDPG
ncbi:MAG: ribokinase, partial [Thermoleophilia bacterium]|nr:ribokinase [Thermoleophilia bacterium]